jgi:O-antigen/teichoic acid export membrane protein
MNNKSKIYNLLIGGTSLALVPLSEKMITFLMLPIFTRYLEPSEYGSISYALMIASIANIFFNPGLLTATIRRMYDVEGETQKKEIYVSSFMYLLFAPFISLVIFIPIWGRIWPSGTGATQFGIITFIIAMTIQPVRFWSAYKNNEFNYIQVTSASLLKTVSNPIISYLLIVKYYLGATGRLLGIAASSMILYIVTIAHLVSLGLRHYNYRTMIESLKMGMPLAVGVITYSIIEYAGLAVIRYNHSLSDMGIYDVAYKMASVVFILSIGLNRMWQPILYGYMNSTEPLSEIKKTAWIYLFSISMLSAILISISSYIVSVFIDSKYLSATLYMPFITFGLLIYAYSNVMIIMLTYDKKLKYLSAISVIHGVLTLFTTIIFNNYFGLIGIAITVPVSNFIHFILVYRHARINYSLMLHVNDMVKINLYILFIMLFKVSQSYLSGSYEITINICVLICLSFILKIGVSTYRGISADVK